MGFLVISIFGCVVQRVEIERQIEGVVNDVKLMLALDGFIGLSCGLIIEGVNALILHMGG